jgi:hypothetical protein
VNLDLESQEFVHRCQRARMTSGDPYATAVADVFVGVRDAIAQPGESFRHRNSLVMNDRGG